MLHESIISRTASAEISQIANAGKINLNEMMNDVLSNIETIDNPIKYTLESVTIFNDNNKRYYVDFESFVNYINTNEEATAIDAWKQLEEEYGILSEDMYLVLPCKDKFIDAINEYDCSTSIAKHRCANSISKSLIMIDNLRNAGINMVIANY